jgi:hypothetical protein
MDQQISDLNETIELLSLDKEQLALEKELLEEQVKELELENRKLKSSSTAAPSSPFVNKELKFLQEENEKLKEALLKLHEKETKEKEQLTESDAKLQELQSIAAQFEEYKKQKDAEISDLLAQIDSLSHFEFLIEKLTGENLDLKQAVEVQKQSLTDLEESQDLNEQLDEHQRKQISEHLKTIDSLEMKISSLEKKMFDKDVVNNDLNKKLETLNQAVKNLQAQNTELNVFLKKENSLLVYYEKNIKNLISFIHENYEQSSFSFSHHQLTFQQCVNYQKSGLFNQRYEFLVNSSFASLWMEENKFLNFENILLSLTAYNFEMENVLLNIYNVLKPFFRILLADKHSKTRESSSSTSASIHNEKLQSLQKLLLMILQIYNFSVLQQTVFHSFLMNQIQDSAVNNNPVMNHSQQIFLLKNELETFVNELNFILQNILKNKTTLAITELNSASSSSSTSFLATSSLSQAPSLDFQESVGSEKRLLGGEVVDGDGAAASEEATNNAANLIDIHEFENYYSKCIHSYHSIARCLEQISTSSSSSVAVSPPLASSSASSSPLHTLLQSVTKSESSSSSSEVLLESAVLFINGMAESLSCSHRCSSTSSTATVGINAEDSEMTEVLRSIKIENESFLVNLKASSSTSSSSAASTSAMKLIEVGSLQHLLHSTTSLLDSYGMFSLAASASENIGKLKEVLGVLRKWNSAIGTKATTGNHEMPVLTYFPSISFVSLVGQWNQSLTVTSSFNANEKKFLEMNYSQLLEKYWKLLFQDNHEWVNNNNSSNDGAVTISWRKRMNKIRDSITAATASTQPTKTAAITENQGLNESESGKFNSGSSQKAELVQQQHLQKELDMNKEQLKSALSRCDELNGLYQNAMNSLQQAAAANSLETRENFEKEQTKLKDEIHTLETALKTMETKIDTINKENRQLKLSSASSSSATAVAALQSLASDSDKAGPASSTTTTTAGAGTVRGGRLDRRRQTTGNTADMNDPKAMLAALASLGGVGGDVNPSPPGAAAATTRTAERKQSVHQLLSPAPVSASSSSSSAQQSLEDHPMIMDHIFHWKQMMVKMLTNSLLPLEAPQQQHPQQQPLERNIQLSNNLQAVIPQRYEDDPRRNIKAVYYESRLNRVRNAKIAAIQVKNKSGAGEEEGKEQATAPPTFRSMNRYLYQQEPIVFQLVK